MITVDPEVAGSQGKVEERRPGGLRRLARRSLVAGSRSPVTLGVLVFYVALVAFFWTAVPGFGTYSNTITLLSSASVVLIVSLGQALAIISGGFDLSVGGVVPLGAVIYARLTNSGIDPVQALAVVVLAGAAVGAVNAFLIGRVGINPLITTLGTLSITGGIAFTIAGGVTLAVDPRAGRLGDAGPGQIPYYMFLALLLSLAVHFLLKRTVFGRRIYTIGGNAEAARLAGIRVDLVQFGIYMLASALAAFAGVVVASQVLAATGALGSDTTLVSVAAVVLGGAALTGGTGGVPGTLLGVLLLGTVADGMNIMRVPAFYQQVVTGCVLLGAVAFGRLQEVWRARSLGTGG